MPKGIDGSGWSKHENGQTHCRTCGQQITAKPLEEDSEEHMKFYQGYRTLLRNYQRKRHGRKKADWKGPYQVSMTKVFDGKPHEA
jgi:hypothetical protein